MTVNALFLSFSYQKMYSCFHTNGKSWTHYNCWKTWIPNKATVRQIYCFYMFYDNLLHTVNFYINLLKLLFCPQYKSRIHMTVLPGNNVG